MEEKREFHVYLPPSYAENSVTRYPVVYLLDGDIHRLKAVSGILEGLSSDTLEKQTLEAIVVAIPTSTNAIRERDLTPTNVDWVFDGNVLEEFEDIGNAENYAKFFKTELIPEINNRFRTETKKLLIGESFGGLFSAYVLLNHSETFTDYLIIDATYLWDNNYLNRTFDAKKQQASNITVNVVLTFANNAAFGAIGKTNKEWGFQFFDNLSSINSGNFNVEKLYFDDESHGTVALLSWYRGFRILLRRED